MQEMDLKMIRVTTDGTICYDAWVDPTNRWNGYLSPSFPLGEVRKLAKDTQADMESGYQVDTIHVVDGYQLPEIDGVIRRTPATVVLFIEWDDADKGPEQATTIVVPDENGRYPIGGYKWTWYQAEEIQPAVRE